MMCRLTQCISTVLVLNILSLPAVLNQGMNPPPPPSLPPRFSTLSECLQGSTLDCVTCATQVTVNRAEGSDCEPGQSLANQVCNSLHDVLESVANMDTTHPPMSCIEIRVHPIITFNGTVGRYIVNVDEQGIDIQQNVVIRGINGEANDSYVRVLFPQRNTSMVREEAVYSLDFSGSSLVGLDGLVFEGRYGIVGMEEIRVVAIDNCQFSNFPQGAVDIYNCPTVFLRNTRFAYNGNLSVAKMEPYRGHAAGASIAFDLAPGENGPLVRVIECVFLENTGERFAVLESNVNFTTGTDPTTATNDENNNDENNNNNNNNNNNDDDDNRGRNRNDNSRPMTEGERFDARGSAFQSSSFPGRGGGLAVIVNAMEEARVLIRNCIFESNGALEFGGGMYTYLEGRSSHNVTISGCRFSQNFCPSTGGGLHMSFMEEARPGSLHQVLVYDTQFIRNNAEFGGGVFFISYVFDPVTFQDHRVNVFTSFNNCTFRSNTAQEVGGALGVASTAVASGIENTRPLEIINCEFTENSVDGAGIVSITTFPVSFLGVTTFSQNRGPCLAIIGSLVRVAGTLSFRDNTNTRSLDGGAVYITSLGQLQMTPNTAVNFVRNEGSNGAALVVQEPAIPNTFSKLFFNPLCPLLFINPILFPDSWTDYNVSMRFARNEAIVAAAVYANEMDACSWTGLSPPYFNQSRVYHWDFMSFIDNRNKAHTNETDIRWAVQTPAVRLRLQQDNLLGFPGERLSLRVFAFDELNEPTAATIRIIDETVSTETGNITRELYRFVPSSVSLNNVTNGAQLDLRFQRQMLAPLNPETITIETVLGASRKSFAMDTFSLRSRRCPPGSKLLGMSRFLDCVCDSTRNDIVTCNGRRTILANQLWGFIDNSTMPGGNDDPLVTFPCPSGYCTCVIQNTTGSLQCNYILDSSSQHSQCHCNRQGILCGDCNDGLGFSTLLDRCVSCNDGYGGLLLVLFVVDVIVIVTLLVAMVPIPLWFYPILFHLQLLPYFTEHFPVTFERVRPILYYVASALSLYFPYDFCLNSQLGPLLSYTARYLPLLTAVLLTPVMVAMRYRMCRPCPWHGVWWLVLLLYTSVLHTSMSILNCRFFHAADGSSVFRWYINGNIRCFYNTHIPLAMLALIILALCLALIPLLILLSFDKLTRPRWLHYFAVTLIHAYKPKYKWWSGMELAKRFLLVLFSVVFKNYDYPLIFVLIVLLGVIGFMKPYKRRMVNILDVVLASNVLILLLLRNTEYIKDELHAIPEQPTYIINNSLSSAPNSSSDRPCLQITGLSSFVILLTPFYYLPLFISLMVCVSWVTYYTYLWTKDLYKVYKNHNIDHTDADYSITSPFESTRMRAFTQTVVDIRECETEDVDTVQQSLPASADVGGDSLTPIASLYLKAKRASYKKRASRKTKEPSGMELQPVPEKTREMERDKESLAHEKVNPTGEIQESRFVEDDGTLEENGGSSTLI